MCRDFTNDDLPVFGEFLDEASHVLEEGSVGVPGLCTWFEHLSVELPLAGEAVSHNCDHG